MIVRIVRMEFQAQHIDAFHLLFDQVKYKILGFPGCVQLELYADADYPNVRYTCSVWDSEHSLQTYRNSPVFREVWPQTKALFEANPRAYSLSLIETVISAGK